MYDGQVRDVYSAIMGNRLNVPFETSGTTATVSFNRTTKTHPRARQDPFHIYSVKIGETERQMTMNRTLKTYRPPMNY